MNILFLGVFVWVLLDFGSSPGCRSYFGSACHYGPGAPGAPVAEDEAACVIGVGAPPPKKEGGFPFGTL